MADELLQRFVRSYPPGAVICSEGEVGSEMYIIQKGKVRVSKGLDRKSYVVSVLEKGDFFGEMALINRVQRTATVTAIDAVELLVFDREGLLNTISRNARIALNIIDKLCRRLQMANMKIQHLVKRDARGLIALHLRYVFQELPTGFMTIPLQKTLDDISFSLELPLEEVRKVMDQFRVDGIISTAGDSIILADRAKLYAITELAT